MTSSDNQQSIAPQPTNSEVKPKPGDQAKSGDGDKFKNQIDQAISGFSVTTEKPTAEVTPPQAEIKNSEKPTADLDIEAIRAAILNEIKKASSSTDLPETSVKPVVNFWQRFRAFSKATWQRLAEKQKEFFKSELNKPLPDLSEKVKPVLEKIKSTNIKLPKIVWPDNPWAVRLRKSFFVVMILLVLLTAGLEIGSWRGRYFDNLSDVIPYPVAYAAGQWLMLGNFNHDVDALNKYLLRSQIKLSDSQVKKKVLASFIERAVVNKSAGEQNLTVSAAEIKQQLDQVAATLAEQKDFDQSIKDLYGYNHDQYIATVVKPLILTQKLKAWFLNKSGEPELIKQMNDYLAQVTKNPATFSKLAGQVNDDSTKATGGDLGYFKLGEMVPEFELQLLNLQPGHMSQVFQTRYGFHIVKLIEKIINKQGEVIFHAAHIFKQPASFQNYLDEQIKKARVITFIKI